MKAFFHDLWIKIKSDAMNAVALLGTMLGSFMSHIDGLADMVGDPNLTQQISNVVHADIKIMAHWVQLVSALLIVKQFKALVQSPPKV